MRTACRTGRRGAAPVMGRNCRRRLRKRGCLVQGLGQSVRNAMKDVAIVRRQKVALRLVLRAFGDKVDTKLMRRSAVSDETAQRSGLRGLQPVRVGV